LAIFKGTLSRLYFWTKPFPIFVTAVLFNTEERKKERENGRPTLHKAIGQNIKEIRI